MLGIQAIRRGVTKAAKPIVLFSIACIGTGCSRYQSGRQATANSRGISDSASTLPSVAAVNPPKGESLSPLVSTTQHVSNLTKFIGFCGNNGVVLKPLDKDEFEVVEPTLQGYRLGFAFKIFPVGTSSLEMRKSLRVFQLAFPYLNEAAGLTMSARIVHGGNNGIAKNAAKNSEYLEHQLASLLEKFRP